MNKLQDYFNCSKRLPAFSLFLLITVNQIISQNLPALSADSLELEKVIQQVVNSHPGMMAAAEAIQTADAKISLSRAHFLPELDVNGSYYRQGPVPAFDFPGFGTIQFLPENNYSLGLNARYTLYDFGRSSTSTEIENEYKALAGLTVEQVKQKLALSTATVYYSLAFLQEAIRIKQEQLLLYKEHLQYVEKKKATGSATGYEILATKVNISNAESQKMDLESAWKTQEMVLNSLLGDSSGIVHPVRLLLSNQYENPAPDSLFVQALNGRDELKQAEEKNRIALLQYKLIQVQNRPVLTAFANAGGKNGYMPYLNDFKLNFSAGVGLRIPIFDARQNHYRLLIAQSTIRTVNLEKELTGRTIRTELAEACNTLASAGSRVNHDRLQLRMALEAYTLAVVNYKAGAMTSLDLFDAQDKVSQSRLLLLKSQIDYEIGHIRFLSALGERLY
ncbi:MAG: TolC family protein [Bacteroidales bacterium]